MNGASVAVVGILGPGASDVQPAVERHAVALVIDDGRGAQRPRRDLHVLSHERRDDAGEDRRCSSNHVLVVH